MTDIFLCSMQVKREVGDVSILVNNAGIVTGKKFMDAPDSLIEKTMEVNTMAHFWVSKSQRSCQLNFVVTFVTVLSEQFLMETLSEKTVVVLNLTTSQLASPFSFCAPPE